jgi:hypothetical protein
MRLLLRTALLGWALLYSRHGDTWQMLGDYPTGAMCDQVRDARIDGEAQSEMGGALAEQSADNPMRREAYQRAARHVAERYRCSEH